jgi:hypothetical protein
MRRRLGKYFLAAACLAGTGAWAQTSDLPTSYTLDLPPPVNTTIPVWLGQPIVPNTVFATLDVPVQPPDSTSSLLVTVFFHEKDGGFLRIFWQGLQGAQLLSDNFYEGIGMSNQRSLLISPEILQGPGAITFQCGDSTLGMERIKFQWLANKSSLVSPEIEDTLVTPDLGATQPAQTLDGQPAQLDPPAWKGRMVNVPITDTPQRIEEGVDFSVQLDDVPTAGRISLQENGLPWGKHLVVWVNQQRAGTITPSVPDLRDAGFLEDSSDYVGWREGSLFVPVSFLKQGADAIQFSVEDDGASTPATTPDAALAPLAVKDVVLQLNYPPLPETTPAPAAVSPQLPPPETDLSIPGASAPAQTPP